jgi:hypothetical protein
MNEILATARQKGIAELFLKAQKVNQAATDYCSRNGFRVVGEERFVIGAGKSALVMRRTLGLPPEGAPSKQKCCKEKS